MPFTQGGVPRLRRDAPPWVEIPPKIHRPEGARQDRDIIAILCGETQPGSGRIACRCVTVSKRVRNKAV
jgi:hypothetical protein